MSLGLCGLHRILKPNDLECLISTVRVPLFHSKKPSALAYRMTTTSVLWPHEMFAWLWENHHTAFVESILGGDASNIERFWRNMPNRPGMQRRRSYKQWCIPIAIHGDGVAVSNVRGKSSKQLDCLSWSSVLARGQTRFTTFLVYFCFSHLAKKKGFGSTWPSFWKQLCKSLQALWAGVWPDTTMDGQEHPWAGQPLAGGFYAVVYVTRGDLDWMAAHFQLRHSGSSRPCALCGCTNAGPEDAQPWTDCNDEPSWKESIWTDKACQLDKTNKVSPKKPIHRNCSGPCQGKTHQSKRTQCPIEIFNNKGLLLPKVAAP